MRRTLSFAIAALRFDPAAGAAFALIAPLALLLLFGALVMAP